jgi:hypothetical protein
VPFTPSNSGQRSPPTYYRGCWHVVSRGFFLWYRRCRLPTEKQFTLRKASSCTRRCSVRVAPIAENSSLLPPVGVWAVLNPSVADRPLRPATDRRLGRLSPHQPANRPQAHPLAPLSRDALLPFSREPMRYCRRFLAGIPHQGAGTHVLLTRPPLPHSLARTRSFDLHVLGTPPAFILSQDQTRHPSVYLVTHR